MEALVKFLELLGLAVAAIVTIVEAIGAIIEGVLRIRTAHSLA